VDGDRKIGWKRAEPLALSRDMSVAQALDGILGNCLSHLAANETAALANAGVEGVHQVRVAARRLRSAVKLFRHVLPAAPRDALDGELKWLSDTLAPARELDVFIQEVLRPAEAGNGAFAGLEAQANARRDAARRRVADALSSTRYAGLKREIERWRAQGLALEGQNARHARLREERIGSAAGPLLSSLHGKTRKRGRHFSDLDPEERHRLRIALKRLRYAVDFFGGLYPAKGHKRYLDRLKRLQDALGQAHDLATSERLIAELVAGRDDPALAEEAAPLLDWRRRTIATLETRLRSGWRRFEDAKPFWSELDIGPIEGTTAVKTLLLLRHAKSSWDDPELDDAERPLAPRGEKTAPKMGRILRREVGWPDLVLCSSATRARQTWDRAAGTSRNGVPTQTLGELYLATPEQLLATLRQAPDSARRLLLVGHNPGLAQLAGQLCGAGEADALHRMAEKFPTAALAEIRLNIERWAEIAPGRGRLTRFVTPRDAKA
jgi:phosphohistidine phosphatase SixA/CHAD domain-containing protein